MVYPDYRALFINGSRHMEIRIIHEKKEFFTIPLIKDAEFGGEIKYVDPNRLAHPFEVESYRIYSVRDVETEGKLFSTRKKAIEFYKCNKQFLIYKLEEKY